jgi:hypothetical protein
MVERWRVGAGASAPTILRGEFLPEGENEPLRLGKQALANATRGRGARFQTRPNARERSARPSRASAAPSRDPRTTALARVAESLKREKESFAPLL